MAESRIGDGTGAGLVEYLDTIVKKGRATPGAITPIRTAFIKVLEAVDGTGWRDVKVEDINVEEHIQRFANLTKGKYTQKSTSVYKSHITRAIGWYLRFMSTQDAGWMPIITPRPAKKINNLAVQVHDIAVAKDENVYVAPVAMSPITQSVVANLISYPFPLRDGQIASLSLPSPIHAADAERIARFVKTLVIDTEIENEEGKGPTNEKSQNDGSL